MPEAAFTSPQPQEILDARSQARQERAWGRQNRQDAQQRGLADRTPARASRYSPTAVGGSPTIGTRGGRFSFPSRSLSASRLRSRPRLSRRDVIGSAEKQSAAAAQLEAAALSGYQKIWQGAHEALEGLALSFVDFFLVTGPAALSLYMTRLIGGDLAGGFSRVQPPAMVRPLLGDAGDVSVPLIPPMTWWERFLVRPGKNLLIFLGTLMIWTIIIVICLAIIDPLGFGKSLFGSASLKP